MESNTSNVRAVFDEWADSGRAEGMEKGHGPTARPAFDRLAVGRESRYLDIGCGNGYTVRWAANAGASAVGIDFSGSMIRRARDLSEGLNNACFLETPFPNPSPSDLLPPASFDAIFSMEVLYYLPDLDQAVARIRELLVPGGLFACVVDFYAENTASHQWPLDLGVEMRLLSEKGWRDLFSRNGLMIVEQSRLRGDVESASAAWKVTQGSLLTLGAKPHSNE